MELRKVVVVVEDVDATRTALQWALHNIISYGDLIILLHVFSPAGSNRSTSTRKLRNLRLRGFHLALSFKSYCDDYPNTKVDIVVREGDGEGRTISEFVKEIGAFALVAGLHDRSFLYRYKVKQAIHVNVIDFGFRLDINHPEIALSAEHLKVNHLASLYGSLIKYPTGLAMDRNNSNDLKCRVFAIKQPPKQQIPSKSQSARFLGSSPNMDFSQIEISGLEVPEEVPQKIPYQVCPSPYGILWVKPRHRPDS